MAWPSAPANGQIFTRADGVQFQFRSASNSWLRLTSGAGNTLIQLFTSLGVQSVTIPAGAKRAKVKGVGGGGKGGDVYSGNNFETGAAGGGSGWGGEAVVELTGVSAVSVNIGAGAVAGSATDGQDTSITFTGAGSITFGGGKGAVTQIVGSAPKFGTYMMRGGEGGAGASNIPGIILLGMSDNGGNGMYFTEVTSTDLNQIGASGSGGSSIFGRGGSPRGSNSGVAPSNSNGGQNGQGYGAGGSGAVQGWNNSGGTGAANGGNGANGAVQIEWFF